MRQEGIDRPGVSGQRGWGLRSAVTPITLLVATLACAAVAAGGVRLSVGDPTLGDMQHRATVTNVTRSSVTVQGIVSTPTPCYALAAARIAALGNLEVTIAARPAPPGDQICVQAIAQLPYTAVADVPGSGTLRVRVNHAYPEGTLPATTALDTTVAIP